MKIAIVSDAWVPQINGVVTTLLDLRQQLMASGHEVVVVEPSMFACIRCPGYPEIGLARRAGNRLAAVLDAALPDAIHIATEGPLGWAARGYCLRRKLPFTTAFHSRFPEFLSTAFGVPASWGYALLRHFHAPSSAVLAPSASTAEILRQRGFASVQRWSHGIDMTLFAPGLRTRSAWRRPVFLYVGRVSPEKSLEDFLRLDLPGSKVVCGGGPLLDRYRRRYPRVHFLGPQARRALVWFYGMADVFVYPSRTDTFGLVMLEAMACGTPVAAYPVAGPIDVVGDSDGGVLDADLRRAALRCLSVPRERARARALEFDWERIGRQFVVHLAPIRHEHGMAFAPVASNTA